MGSINSHVEAVYVTQFDHDLKKGHVETVYVTQFGRDLKNGHVETVYVTQFGRNLKNGHVKQLIQIISFQINENTPNLKWGF